MFLLLFVGSGAGALGILGCIVPSIQTKYTVETPLSMVKWHMVIIIENKLTKEDVLKAREEYKDYIKITMDTEKEIVAIGGEYHADAEKLLIENYNCDSKNILGGGYNISTKEIEFVAMLNVRPSVGNNSMEILDAVKREKFKKIAEEKLRDIESFI